ncbi:DUF4190 domain-containing protein [Jiangella alkaliphila]|uniref:DUF4190 domain-containing protein n=1 Tax=Jiangella alkaliphila TaxID=419479 RepID=A0A1H2G9G5_9ACTN|nr:DUF4190 domain-containing protein [Jiangella alkaliphila]SDU16130.1 protein of unknown function [Jiangella alkaliphila]
MSDPGAPTPTPPPNPYASPPNGSAVPPGPAQYPAYGQPPHGQYPPTYGQHTWPAAPPPRKPDTNGFAIAAFVCGLLPLIPLAIVFGIIALGQTAGRRQDGRWYAIVGIVAASVWTVALVLGGAPTQFLQPDRTPSDWSVLQDGECIDGLGTLPEENPSPSDLTVVPCSGPHEGEVYGTFVFVADEFPGEASMRRESDHRCRELMGSRPPDTVSGAIIGYLSFYPLQGSWPEQRTVACVAYDPDVVRVPGVAHPRAPDGAACSLG